MNERIKELMKEAGYFFRQPFDLWCQRFANLVRADEREFIAERWERLYGYDKQGVAEFIRKRANTQGEQT